MTRQALLSLAIQGQIAALAVTASVLGASVPILQAIFLFSILSLVWFALFAVELPSFYHFFLAAYVLLFMLYPIVAPFVHPRLFDSPALGTYTVYTVVGIHALTIAYALAVKPWPRYHIPVDTERLFSTIGVLLAVNLLGVVVLILDAGSLRALADMGRIEQKTQGGAARLFSLLVGYSGAVLYTLLPSAVRRGPVRSVPICAALLFVEVVLFLGFRIRSWPVAHAVALVIGFLFVDPLLDQTRRVLGARRKSRDLLILTVAAVCVVLGATTLRFARGMFETEGAGAFASVDMATAIQRSLLNGDLGYTPTTLAVMERVPNDHDRLNGQSYYRLFFTVIPRSIWPEKPENTQRVVAGWLTPELPEQTIPPGIQGDLYINFGMAGLAGFLVFGVLIARLDSIRGLFRFLFVGAGFVPIFHLVRGGFTNPLVLLATVGTTAWLVTRFLEANPAQARSANVGESLTSLAIAASRVRPSPDQPHDLVGPSNSSEERSDVDS